MGSPQTDVASLDEIEREINALSDADLLRLERFARYQVFRYSSIDPKEVLGEAVCRVLGGARNWPRHVPLKVFLQNVIRSIADEFRDEARSKAQFQEQGLPAEPSGQGIPPDPATEAALREMILEIWSLFDNDGEVQALIRGVERGLTAKEVQATFGLSEKQYGAARKRLERTLALHYPTGLKL